MSPIQNSPQFLESPIAQLARQYNNETDVKLPKFIYQIASAKTCKQKLLIQTKYPVEKKNNNNNDGIENIYSLCNNEISSNFSRHLEKKRKVELSNNNVNILPTHDFSVTDLMNQKDFLLKKYLDDSSQALKEQETNNSDYLDHENLILPLKTDAQLSPSILLKNSIYDTTNCDDVFNNSCRLNNKNNSFFNSDFDDNNDIISGSTVNESADASTTGKYDDEDGTLVFAIEI